MEFMGNTTSGKTDQTDSASHEGDWIPLMDYATQYGVSLSTLRRHIKARKIQYKIENGRYLLRSPFAPGMVAPRAVSAPRANGASFAQPGAVPAPSGRPTHSSAAPGTDAAAASNEIRELKLRLQRAQEEISELKMLVALYEEQLAQKRPGSSMRVNGY